MLWLCFGGDAESALAAAEALNLRASRVRLGFGVLGFRVYSGLGSGV